MKNKEYLYGLIVASLVILIACVLYTVKWYMPAIKKRCKFQILKRGDTGAAVVRLQLALNTYKAECEQNMPEMTHPEKKLIPDGRFGTNTQAALITYHGKSTITQGELVALENFVRQ